MIRGYGKWLSPPGQMVAKYIYIYKKCLSILSSVKENAVDAAF